jgi:putative membrane protein
VLQNLILQAASGILGIWLADQLVEGVIFTGSLPTLVLAGFLLGLVNSFLKPVLKIITAPIRIITLGLFGLVINMAMVWLIDLLFPELIIYGIVPLFWTTLIVWGTGLIVSFFGKRMIKKSNRPPTANL